MSENTRHEPMPELVLIKSEQGGWIVYDAKDPIAANWYHTKREAIAGMNRWIAGWWR